MMVEWGRFEMAALTPSGASHGYMTILCKLFEFHKFAIKDQKRMSPKKTRKKRAIFDYFSISLAF